MELIDVIRKLVGPIEPVGETNADDKRYENLKVMVHLIDIMLSDVDAVSVYKDSPQYSKKRASRYAIEFFNSLGIKE